MCPIANLICEKKKQRSLQNVISNIVIGCTDKYRTKFHTKHQFFKKIKIARIFDKICLWFFDFVLTFQTNKDLFNFDSLQNKYILYKMYPKLNPEYLFQKIDISYQKFLQMSLFSKIVTFYQIFTSILIFSKIGHCLKFIKKLVHGTIV